MKVGGGTDPATEVTHFGLNKPLVFSSVRVNLTLLCWCRVSNVLFWPILPDMKEIFLGLGVTVTEINIKKVQKQDLKILKMQKDVARDDMPKVCKQGRDAIIVR